MTTRLLMGMLGAVLTIGCGGDDASDDLLGQIQNRGTLRVSTDAAFPPASEMNADGTFQGFDVDTANAIGTRLGVTVEFVTPDWDVITAGGWGDAWDISVGSMTITTERERSLHFVRPPYYYAPAYFAATSSSGITTVDGIMGQSVCVGSETTYESYLSSGAAALGFPDTSVFLATAPSGITIVSKPADQDCFDEIAAGTATYDVVLTSETLIDDVVAGGAAVVKVGGAVYTEELAVSIDRSHTLSSDTLMTEVAAAVEALHADGTLRTSSEMWFGTDLTRAPSGG